ncbi:MAG TPA: VanZ family protein [Chitinophaga sp.]|uniref:VanZ family protein n=1 Tax=Chitinophaga sp. TaxID=1869181 RepID=UPI002F942E1D
MKGLKVLAALGYGVILSYIVLWAPARRERPIEGEYRTRLTPFKSTWDDMIHYKGNNALVHWVLFLGNFFGNILLFVPFAFVMMIVFRITSIRTVILLGFLSSGLIEIVQYITHLGVADVDDVMLNTVGTAIGAYLCRFFLSRLNMQS